MVKRKKKSSSDSCSDDNGKLLAEESCDQDDEEMLEAANVASEHEESDYSDDKDEGFSSKDVDPIQFYLKEIGFSPLLSQSEEVALARRIVAGDKVAKNKMIESNLRLVVNIARNYSGCGIDISDLIEEGNLGLISAADKFNPDLGFRFSTYATWWIRQSVERAIMNQSRMVRLPIHVIREMRSYHRRSLSDAKDNAIDNSFPAGTDAESAPANGLDESPEVRSATRVRKILNLEVMMGQETISLDAPTNSDEGNGVFADQLEDENARDPSMDIQDENMRKIMAVLVDDLTETQREILIKSFGLDGRGELSLEQLADNMNLGKERVRQLQNHALRKLRNIIMERGMSDEVKW